MRSSPTARSGITGISIIQLLATWCLALALIAGLTHSYKLLAAIGAVVGVGVLVATLLILWWLQRHDRGAAPGSPDARRREQAIRVGLICGLLWVVEISVNNFLAPPLPGRDWFDDVIWAAASVLILAGAAHAAYRGRRIRIGIRFGAWSGLASGMVACAMALSIVVFGMSFLVADPLNVREWAERGAASGAPSIAEYVAFETFAGAFAHLLVVGLAMSTVLGALGGLIGAALAWLRTRTSATR